MSSDPRNKSRATHWMRSLIRRVLRGDKPYEKMQRLWELWHNRMVGQTVRGQQVEHCEIIIDSLGRPEKQDRIILTVLFRENMPGEDMSDEQVLLQRVFNRVPWSASTVLNGWDDLVAVLSGKREVTDWCLDDELREGAEKGEIL